jgi:hypothetical protein
MAARRIRGGDICGLGSGERELEERGGLGQAVDDVERWIAWPP